MLGWMRDFGNRREDVSTTKGTKYTKGEAGWENPFSGVFLLFVWFVFFVVQDALCPGKRGRKEDCQ
jgi:hypothetical protein